MGMNEHNYEKEYAEAMKRLEKAEAENRFLREELKCKENSLLWYDGIKQTVEVIFGREFYNA
jgi:hypothetical protein